MPPERIERRLAAILVADVAGYSRLMGAEEETTLARIKAHRLDLIDPKIAEHHGRIVKTTGDGMLVEFPSIVDAMRCAVEVQRGMAEFNANVPEATRIEFRIGINLGDIIVDGGDIYGDGVNIAARLEKLADPSGICISQTVLDHASGKIFFDVEDCGDQALKNIAQPVHVYRVLFDGRRSRAMFQVTGPALELPGKPSIAVLPFQNMSGDPEQDYFADGMVEEIITALSRMHWLFVIARNSSFTFKGRAVDIKQVGRELGVRYVLEGSVRKSPRRVRITGQLIDASTGMHLWADRFDGGIEDIFDLQDQVAASVVGAIAPKLQLAEIDRAKRKPTESLDAYDYYLRGIASAHRFTKDASSEALPLFQKAIELDPNFGAACGGAVRIYVQRRVNGWTVDHAQEAADTTRLARHAVALGKDDADALTWGALGLAHLGNLDDGAAFVDQALRLNPNLAAAWHVSALIRVWLGEPETALEHEMRAMRLSPLDPLMGQMQSSTAWAHFLAGRCDDASAWAERAIRAMPSWAPAYIAAAASHAIAGRLDDAREAMAHLRQRNPALRIADLGKVFPLRRPEDLARYAGGLRKAGMPE